MAPPLNLEQLLTTRIFPGMTIDESRLVRAFLAKRGAEWDVADVTFRVGRGAVLPPTYDPVERANWERRTRSRPDLVLLRAPNVVMIVEAKEQLTNEGIWQVLGYRDLYLADNPNDQVTVCAIATAVTSTALQLARSMGVQVLLYELDPNTPLAGGDEVAPL